jgi:serine/threonine protein kinase
VASAPDKVPVHDALSPGTRLDEFEILRVLGTGGFGIVYLARDHVLLREVAIKEYMPAVLAGRGEGVTVSLRSPGAAETFAEGLESFLNEARLLASFDHPSLVKVHRFWRSNATAYMAMQYYPGQTLKEARRQMPAAPGEAWLDAFIQPLLGALDVLHGKGVYHRDISPDNILMLPDGQPVLLDFGSARRVVANGAQSFTAHLKPPFAPLEQYADEAGMQQGAWTDLYALGATLHFVLTGRAPTPSVVRAVRDVLPTVSSLAGSTFRELPARWLATIDWTLALAPDERPQDVLSVRRALSGDVAPPPAPLRQTTVTVPAPPPRPQPSKGAAPVRAAASEPSTPAAREGTDAREPSTPAGRERTDSRRGIRWTSTRSGTRRGVRLGAAALVAFMGATALAWGVYTLNRPLPGLHGQAAVLAEAPKWTTSPGPSSIASPAPVFVPVFTPGADPVAMRVAPEPAPASTPAPEARAVLAAVATDRSVPTTDVAFTAPRAFEPERKRTARPKPRPAPAPVRAASSDRKNACTGSDLFARALCALNPCKNLRSRSSSQCLDRQRAEDVRLRRMARE